MKKREEIDVMGNYLPFILLFLILFCILVIVTIAPIIQEQSNIYIAIIFCFFGVIGCIVWPVCITALCLEKYKR